MSATLKWRPNNLGTCLPDELRHALQKRFFSESAGAHHLTESDLSYLQGLDDAGIKGADILLAAVQKHSDVVIWLEY